MIFHFLFYLHHGFRWENQKRYRGKKNYEPFLWNEMFDNVILTVLYPYSHKTRSDSERRIIKKNHATDRLLKTLFCYWFSFRLKPKPSKPNPSLLSQQLTSFLGIYLEKCIPFVCKVCENNEAFQITSHNQKC